MSILGYGVILGPVIGSIAVTYYLDKLNKRLEGDSAPAKKKTYAPAEGIADEMDRREARRAAARSSGPAKPEPLPVAASLPYDEEPGLDVPPPGFVLADYSGRSVD